MQSCNKSSLHEGYNVPFLWSQLERCWLLWLVIWRLYFVAHLDKMCLRYEIVNRSECSLETTCQWWFLLTLTTIVCPNLGSVFPELSPHLVACIYCMCTLIFKGMFLALAELALALSSVRGHVTKSSMSWVGTSMILTELNWRSNAQ